MHALRMRKVEIRRKVPGNLLLEGHAVAGAVKRAAWIGARAVQVLGDTEGLPTREQLTAESL